KPRRHAALGWPGLAGAFNCCLDLMRDPVWVVEREESAAAWHRRPGGVREGLGQLMAQLQAEHGVCLAPQDPDRAGERAEAGGGVEQDARVHCPGELRQVAADRW